MTDRAVSTTLNYVLGLTIATLLVVGLISATGGFIEDRRTEAIVTELEVIGQRTASGLMTADRLAQSGAEDVRVDVSLPGTVAGSGYDIEVNASAAGSTIILASTDPEVRITVSFVNTTHIESGSMTGGDLEIVLATDGDLEVRRA